MKIDIADIRFDLILHSKSHIPSVFLNTRLNGYIDRGYEGAGSLCKIEVFVESEDGDGGWESGSGPYSSLFHGEEIILHLYPDKKRVSLHIRRLEGYLYLYNALYWLTASLLASEGGCLIHGAGIAVSDRGYLFIGPSGAGKTTISRILMDSSIVMSDEAVGIRKEGGRYMVYPTPFGAREVGTPEYIDISRVKVPLTNIFVLKKDMEDFIERLDYRDSVGALVSNVPFWDLYRRCEAGRLLAFLCELAGKVPVNNLHFTRSSSFLKEVIACGR